MTDIGNTGASLIADVSGASQVSDVRSIAAEVREARKQAGLCTRCGREQASDDCLLGPKCRKKQKKWTRQSMKRRRTSWRRRGLCIRCGRKKLKGPLRSRHCPACLVEFGQLQLRQVKQYVKRASRDAGWEARAEGDGYARNRYRGQGKRGRQSAERLDGQDRRDVQRCIDHGFEGLVYFRTEEIQLLPRTQRDDVKAASLAELWRARRFIDDVLARNRFVRPKVEGPDLDEDDQE